MDPGKAQPTPLSPLQVAVLSALLESPAPLPTLAHALALPLPDLLTTAQALTPHLEAAHRLAHLQSTLHAPYARAVAIAALTDIAANPDADPIERRRAATAVLRGTNTGVACSRPREHVPPGATASPSDPPVPCFDPPGRSTSPQPGATTSPSERSREAESSGPSSATTRPSGRSREAECSVPAVRRLSSSPTPSTLTTSAGLPRPPP